jgi:REP element-mobilizing transposase RayT
VAQLCLVAFSQSDDISAVFLGHRSPRAPGADSWSAAEAFPAIGQNHYLTFSCYHRQSKLRTPAPRDLFIRALETVRQQYELVVYGFVVMPEHVHLLVGEPEKGELAQALQSLKQSVARRLAYAPRSPSGKRATTTTSASGTNASSPRSYATFIVTPSRADSWVALRIGRGRVSGTI